MSIGLIWWRWETPCPAMSRYRHSDGYVFRRIRIRTGHPVSPLGNTHSQVREQPGRWQIRDYHLSCSWVSTGHICRYLSGWQEGLICQHLSKLICLVNVRVTRKDRAWHYKGKRLEKLEKTDGNEKRANSRKGKVKQLVDRKRALAGKVEGL